jgi:M6 family metalloprotease-like protein
VQSFITDVLEQLMNPSKNQKYNTEVLPALRRLSKYTSGGVNYTYALNIMYAGKHATTWSKGLWPHKWEIQSSWSCRKTFKDENNANVNFHEYQMTSVLSQDGRFGIGTICHENGHMVCQFPDLYQYEGTGYGAGWFSLMAYGNDAYKPVGVDPYLMEFVGWISPIVIPSETTAMELVLPNDRSTVYKYIVPNSSNKKYFLIENRQKTGIDELFPGKGIVIWRCNADGDNTHPTEISIGDGQTIKSYELAVV